MAKSTDLFREHFIDPSKCLYLGTLVLTVIMFLMSVVGIVGNIISVVILKKLMFSREIEHRLMTFILIAIALNDLLYEICFPPLVFIYNVYPEYLQQKDWYSDVEKGEEPLFGRDSELLSERIQLGRNVMKYSLQPGLMLNSLLLYLLLAFYLWYCARLKATIGNVRPEEMLRRRQTLFKLTTCGTPVFVTALCSFMFYAAEIKGKDKITLFAAASFLIAICVPIVILNYKRLRGVKQLIKELEGLRKGLDSSSSSEEDSDDEDNAKDGPSQPPGHYLGVPIQKNVKSSDEHNRFSGDSYLTTSSGSHNLVVRDDDQSASAAGPRSGGVPKYNYPTRISMEGMKSRLDRLFRKKEVELKKSKSEEEINRRHNNWKLTAIISSLCSVACVLPSMVYFIVKSTSFFSREYKAEDLESVCVGYISLSSLYMLIAPINFCVNPFVYYLTNQEFREMLTETFRCKKASMDSDFQVSLDSFIQLGDFEEPQKRSSKKKKSTRV